jgi:sugar lactone lactonase YvrE
LSAKTYTTQPFVTEGISFPESPNWWDGRLWFVDMFVQRICFADEDGSVTTVAEVPSFAGGLGRLPNGDIVVVSKEERRLMRLPAGSSTLEEYVDLTDVTEGMVNDIYVNDEGGIYVGNYGAADTSGRETRELELPVLPTHLVYVDPDGNARRVGPEIHMPNGTVERSDGTLVVAASYGNRLHELKVEPDGDLIDAGILVELDESVMPDGICIDAEGGVWVCSPEAGSDAVRFDTDGEVTARIEKVGATACRLGGADGRTLFLLGATADDLADIREGRSRGYVRTATVDVPAP